MATPDTASQSQWRDPSGPDSAHLERHLTLVNPEPQVAKVPGVFLERPDLERLKQLHELLGHYMLGWEEATKWRLRCRELRSDYLEQVADRAKETSYWTGVERLLRAQGLRARLPVALIGVLAADKADKVDEFEDSLVEALKKVQRARTPQEGVDLETIAYDVRNFVIVMEEAVDALAGDFGTLAKGLHGDSADWVTVMLDRLARRTDEAPQSELPDTSKVPEEAAEESFTEHKPGVSGPKSPGLPSAMGGALRHAFGLSGFTVAPDVAGHGLTSSSRT
jgi:hypothetical protein